MKSRSLTTLILAGSLLFGGTITTSAEEVKPVEVATNGIPFNGTYESNYDYNNYDPVYEKDPLGWKALFDFKAHAETLKQIAEGPTTLLSLIGKFLTMDIRQALIDMVFQPLSTKLFHTSTRIIDSQGFENLFKFFTRMSMAFLVLLFVWNGLKAIVGGKSTPITAMFLKTIIGLVYLSSVSYIIKGIIWVNNSLCAMVINSVGGKGIFNPIFDPSFGAIHLILFMIIYLVYCIRLLFYYFGRDYLITLLVIVTPFMWFMWVDDSLKRNAATWLRHLITLVFTQLIHAIQLAIFSVIIISLGGTSDTLWGNIESLIFAIVAMAYMVQAPNFVKHFTYEASNGNMGAAMKQLAAYIAFSGERKVLGALIGRLGNKKK